MEEETPTGINSHTPQYAGWRDAEDTSARNFRREIAREERELLRQNQSEHEDLRARVDRLERNMERREPVIEAASTMVAASKMVKAAIVILAVLLSVITGAIQIFDRWLQR
jgi:hypothetical protein